MPLARSFRGPRTDSDRDTLRLVRKVLRIISSVAGAVVLFAVLSRVLNPVALIAVGLGVAAALQLVFVLLRRLRPRFADRFAKPS